MDIFITFLTTLGNAVLIFLALKKDHRNATHITFALMNVLVVILNIVNVVPLHTSDPAVTLWWIRGAIFVVPLYLFSVWWFVYTFPSSSFHFPSRSVPTLVVVASLVAILLSLNPLVFSDVSFVASGRPLPSFGRFMPVYALVAIILVLTPILLLVRRYQSISGYEKSRLGFLLVGIIMSVTLLTIFNFLSVILLHTSAFIPYSPFFIMIFVLFSFLAIIRFRFLNIRVVIQRNALSVATFLIFLVLTFTFATLLVQRVQYAFVFIPLFAALFSLVPWMRVRVARRIEHMFLFEEVDFAEYFDLDRYRLGFDNARKHAFELQTDLRKVFDLAIEVCIVSPDGAFASVAESGSRAEAYSKPFLSWLVKHPAKDVFTAADTDCAGVPDFLQKKHIAALLPIRFQGKVFGALVIRDRNDSTLSSEVLERLKSNARGTAYVFDAIYNFEISHRAWRISLYRKKHGISIPSLTAEEIDRIRRQFS